MLYVLAGQYLSHGVPFTYGEINYPGTWLGLSTKEDRDALGIVEITPELRPDDRYYFVTDNGDGTYTATPRNLSDVKLGLIAEIKATANALLAPTDWYIVRLGETGQPPPVSVSEYRGDVRDASTLNEEDVVMAVSIEELQSLTLEWPAPYAPPVPTVTPTNGSKK